MCILAAGGATLTPHLAHADGDVRVVERWGGKHVSLLVLSNDRAQFQFDCAHGSGPWWYTGTSHVESEGTLTRESGVHHPGMPVQPVLTHYGAEIDGDEMQLTVKSMEHTPVEYTLRKDAAARLFHCP
jgi:hypothetical protein